MMADDDDEDDDNGELLFVEYNRKNAPCFK